MRLPFVLLMGISLFAQEAGLLPLAQRKDVSGFTYTDWPKQNKTSKVSEAKGKVMVVAFLAEGRLACTKSLAELRWLQEQQDALGLLVIPVYDPSSRSVLPSLRRGNGGGDVIPGLPAAGRKRSGPMALSSDGNANNPRSDGMFKNLPISFNIYQEFANNAHSAHFPAFDGMPAVFVLDRQGHIAASLYGYEKGTITKAVQALLAEK